MITIALVIGTALVALFVGLCAGAGMALAVHQREFTVYKAEMDAMLRARDVAMGHMLEALETAHTDLQTFINQTAQLSDLNSRILSAMCKTSAVDSLVITPCSDQKH